MSRKKLAIAIPASVIFDTPHLREKTSKIGLIGRGAAVFRVDEIIVYLDNSGKGKQRSEADLIALLLAYLETPQYLRKRLFKLDSRLQYAGILPPLRTPHHPLNRKAERLKVGEYREGVTVSKTKEGVLVDIGVEQPALMRETQWALDKRLTLQVVKAGERVEVLPVVRQRKRCGQSHNRNLDTRLQNQTKWTQAASERASRWLHAAQIGGGDWDRNCKATL